MQGDDMDVQLPAKAAINPASKSASSRSMRELSDLPGPRGWPVLGNLLQIDAARLHTILGDWAKEFGPLYRFRVAQAENVAIADTELIHDILRERPDGFRRLSAFRDVMAELGIDGVLTAEGLDWRRQRKLTMHALNTHHLLEFFERLDQVTARLQRRWERAAARGERVDAQRDLMRFTVDVTSGLVFGHDLNTLENEGDIIQRHLDKLFPAIARRFLTPIPYWRWFRLPEDRKLDAAMTEVHKLVNDLVAEAKARVANATERTGSANLLDAMVAAQNDDTAGFTDAEIVANTLTMLLAGEDTTANTLAWMMHLLAEHTEVQDKMRNEVDRILGSAERATDYASTEALHYVEAAAHEAMRLKPVAPIIGLAANIDTTIGNVRVPKDTGIYLLTGHTATMQSNFADPQAFRPERWLETAATSAVVHNTKAFAPFGGGARFCPGRHLAMLEIKLVAAMVCRNFEVARVEGSSPPEEVWGITMMPRNAWVTLRRRRA
jgi:cytochrome P450